MFGRLLTSTSRRFLSRTAMSTLSGLNTKALKKGDSEPPALAPGHARVYNMRFCPWAERALIYLVKKEIPVEVVNIDLQQKPEWYFKKHPQGKVPAFEHDGKVVIESGIIPEYLDAVYPQRQILPADPYERAKQRILVDQLAVLPPLIYGLATLKEIAQREEKVKTVEAALDDIEQRLLVSNFFGGSSAGYADYLVIPFFERLYILSLRGIAGFDTETFPGTKWPKLTRWFEAVYKSPEVQAVIQLPEVHAKFAESYAAGTPNYDTGI